MGEKGGDVSVFTGSYEHSVDTKGRIIIPSKFREELGERFIVTQGLDGCIFIYPMNKWEEFVEQLQKLPGNKEGRKLHRYFLAYATEVEIDKQGRALIPQGLRDMAEITKNVVLVGVIGKIEIWDKTKWEQENTYKDMDEVAERMAEFDLRF